MCEMPAIFESKEIIARKNHRCCECWSLIVSGEKYQRINGLWPSVDGWDTFATCLVCAELRNEYSDVECLGFGELREAVFDDPPRDRGLLPPVWLTELDDDAIEQSEFTPSLEAQYNQTRFLAGLYRVHDENRDPKQWKRYQERLMESAAHAGCSIYYHKQQLEKPDCYNPSYHTNKLEGAAV